MVYGMIESLAAHFEGGEGDRKVVDWLVEIK